MTRRKEALGRGLGALLGNRAAEPVPVYPRERAPEPAHESPEAHQVESQAGVIRYVPVREIKPNPHQPRQRFSEDSLEELSASIQEHGVLQPILLTQDKQGIGYLLVAGERRFRAAERAGLKEIPAIIQAVSEEEMLEIAIVENVQRDDLNAVEEARAYRSLIDSFGWSQEQVAQRVGKKRSTVANALRLLKLGSEALKELEEGRMTPGHARAILSIDDAFYRNRLRQEVTEKGISVREAEKRAVSYQKSGSPTGRLRKKSGSDEPENIDTVALEDRIMAQLGCRVRIKSRDGRSGTVEIPFRNPDELDRFLQAVGVIM